MDENKKAAQKKKISHFITMAVLVILFLAFIFPFIMVIFNAFKTKGDITADPLALVGSHGFILTNFTDAMKKMNFATSFTNSLLITTVSTILTIMLSAMTAFVSKCLIVYVHSCHYRRVKWLTFCQGKVYIIYHKASCDRRSYTGLHW